MPFSLSLSIFVEGANSNSLPLLLLLLLFLDQIDILCKGEALGHELSLEFVQKTRWANTSKIIEFNYRPNIDL